MPKLSKISVTTGKNLIPNVPESSLDYFAVLIKRIVVHAARKFGVMLEKTESNLAGRASFYLAMA